MLVITLTSKINQMSDKKAKISSQKSDYSTQDSPKFPRSYSRQKSIERYLPDSTGAVPASLEDIFSRYKVSPLPASFPKLEHVKLPFVRDVGVKVAIENLAEVFGCKEYKLNAIQFWFLDIIADCLWRTQDEFQFPEHHQKIILEWMLYTFNLIRDEHLNLTRKAFSKVIREALAVAEDHIETGSPSVPLPEELFSLELTKSVVESSSSSEAPSSETSLDQCSDDDSYIAIKFAEQTKFFKLPKKVSAWISDDDCLSTSVETLSEDGRPPLDDVEPEEVTVKEESSESMMDEETNFYKPDIRTPPRFLPSNESLYESSSSTTAESVEESSVVESGDATWIACSSKFPKGPCPSKILDMDHKSSTQEKKFREEEVLQALFDYHLWQLRKEEMADPRKGTTFPFDSERVPSVDQGDTEDGNNRDRIELEKYLSEKDQETKQLRENIFVNTCVLLAIKQFIFDYFHESFHFFLLKTSFRSRHSLVTQELQDEWCVPKNFKGELKKPVPRKVKKPKTEKERKPKKEKPPKEKKDKKSKDDKKSKKSESTKKGKKSKSSKDNDLDKKGKKVKVAETGKLSKEEKEEIARIEKELEKQEEEQRKEEENRRFMFPLADAATDLFFQHIFDDWVRPKGKEKKEKEPKEGKGKKSEKSDSGEIGKGGKKGSEKGGKSDKEKGSKKGRNK